MFDRKIKFGSFIPIPTTPVTKLIEIARVNEEAGFDSIWAADHLLFVPLGTVPEAWTILTAIAMVTKKAMLGTCVTDVHRYHPAVLAQRIATIDQISAGRVILGLGAGEAMNLQPFGIERRKPVSKLIETVSIMRKLWSGETFSYEGEFWKLKDAFLQIQPIQPRLPIYLGANSPRMLRLTGQIADGWLPTPLSPELYKKRLRFIEEGAQQAGRSISEIDTGLYLYTALADQAEDAHKQLDTMKPMIVTAPELLHEAGYKVEVPKEIRTLAYTDVLPTGEWIELFAKYGDVIPREAAVEFSIAGTSQDCINKIEEYVKVGVNHFVLINMGPSPRRVMETYGKEIIPRFHS